jgi:hypothetical protein
MNDQGAGDFLQLSGSDELAAVCETAALEASLEAGDAMMESTTYITVKYICYIYNL